MNQSSRAVDQGSAMCAASDSGWRQCWLVPAVEARTGAAEAGAAVAQVAGEGKDMK